MVDTVNAPPAEREASGNPLEGGEDNFLGHLKPKSEARNTKWFDQLTTLSPVERQIRMTKITMTMLIAQMAILATVTTMDSTKERTGLARKETRVTTRVTPQLASREQMKS